MIRHDDEYIYSISKRLKSSCLSNLGVLAMKGMCFSSIDQVTCCRKTKEIEFYLKRVEERFNNPNVRPEERELHTLPLNNLSAPHQGL